MNTSLLNLYNDGIISEKTAYSYTTNPENLGNKIYYLGKRKNMDGADLDDDAFAKKSKGKDKTAKKGKKAVSKDALNNLVSAPSNDDAAYSSQWEEDSSEDWGDWEDDDAKKGGAKAHDAGVSSKKEDASSKKRGLFNKK